MSNTLYDFIVVASSLCDILTTGHFQLHNYCLIIFTYSIAVWRSVGKCGTIVRLGSSNHNLGVEFQTHYMVAHSSHLVTFMVYIGLLMGRNQVRYFIKRCLKCFRYKTRASEQFMGSLPASCLWPIRKFLSSGIDYAGPVHRCSSFQRAF